MHSDGSDGSNGSSGEQEHLFTARRTCGDRMRHSPPLLPMPISTHLDLSPVAYTLSGASPKFCYLLSPSSCPLMCSLPLVLIMINLNSHAILISSSSSAPQQPTSLVNLHLDEFPGFGVVQLPNLVLMISTFS